MKLPLSENKTLNMTAGKVRPMLISFAMPLMFGNLFQQLYSMVDTAVVGQGVGYKALAAVGVAAPVVQLFLGLGIGLANGISVVIAQQFGSNNAKRTREAVSNGIYLSAAVTLLITVGGVLLCRPLLRLINTPGEIIEEAALYATINFWGAAATVCYNVQAGILRALGNSRTPLLFLVITSLLNVILDFLFVMGFGWGVAGAAVATVIAQIISCICCFLYIRKHFKILHFQKGEWHIDSALMGSHIKIGTPLAFFDCILFVSFLLLQASLNSLGSVDMAAYTAASKMDTVMYRILGAFGTAVATFTAQNYGNASFSRIREGVRSCMKITIAISIAATILIFCFGKYFMLLFVGTSEQEVIAAGTTYMRIASLFYIILGVNFAIRFALIGLGKSSISVMVGVMEVIVRSVSTHFLVSNLGFLGMTFPNPLCWLTSTVFVALLYPQMMKKAELLKNKGSP
ncbi:MATE family efflux transporter [Treponema primitia]|uniref:MATE family efflux transporter n=1 Tax=Treponema primitia TaxID=88058 RepID=UPI00397F94CC